MVPIHSNLTTFGILLPSNDVRFSHNTRKEAVIMSLWIVLNHDHRTVSFYAQNHYIVRKTSDIGRVMATPGPPSLLNELSITPA